jgi:lysyl-tRNA synthetase class I
MARGKKTDNETIYKIMISMFSTGNFSETARQLDLPITTVETIYKNNIDKEEFVKLRNEKQDEFVDKATKIINKALDRLTDMLEDKEERIAVNNLSTVIGTLYDKRALAKGESTTNASMTIKMDKKVEELSQ